MSAKAPLHPPLPVSAPVSSSRNRYTLEKSRSCATKSDTVSPWFLVRVGGMLIVFPAPCWQPTARCSARHRQSQVPPAARSNCCCHSLPPPGLSGIERALHQRQHQRAAKAVPEMIIHLARQPRPAEFIGARRIQRNDDMIRCLRPGPIDEDPVLSLQKPALDLADDLRAAVEQHDIASRTANIDRHDTGHQAQAAGYR